MKKLVVKIFVLILITTAGYSQAHFSINLGTGFGFQGLRKINGGAYSGDKVSRNPDGSPYWDFKNQFPYYVVGANIGWKKAEFGFEVGSANFKSDLSYLITRTEAEINFLNINMSYKYKPLDNSIKGFEPYIKGYFDNLLYVYTHNTTPIQSENGVGITGRTSDWNPIFGIYVGTDYMITKHVGAYLQIGYGFETCQFGTFYKI
jgi:hypothetical protein